jgi:predicted small lipoprotein YifL
MRFFFDLLVFILLVIFLASCASSGPGAEPPACRGAAFSINTSSSQTAGPL